MQRFRYLLASRGIKLSIPLFAAAPLAAVALTISAPQPAQAHCDSVDGPVVGAARQALEKGDVNLVLPYIKPEAEPELTGAFNQTVAVRKLGGQAQQVSDRYFFETTVRLHRLGEGASYTGLKDKVEISPALEAAEKSLETNDSRDAYWAVRSAVWDGVQGKWDAVVKARATAAKEGTVEANREKVEAELAFEKYVDELYKVATTTTVSHAGE